MFLVFSNYFDVLMSKIIFFLKKNQYIWEYAEFNYNSLIHSYCDFLQVFKSEAKFS